MTDKTALVSGANRGLGFETARQLAEKGYRVLLGIRDPAKGKTTKETFRNQGFDAHFVELDTGSPASIEKAAAEITERFGALDVLVNNAAVHYDTWQRVDAPDFRIVEEALAINTLGPWRLTVALLPLLRASGSARIVNVSSGSGQLGSMTGTTPGYSLSKIGLNALTLMFANELRGSGILVNAVCPGWVATDMGGGGRPIPEGARGIVWAATLSDNGPTGGFFRDGKPIDW
jgi:NAD(P)-dependent dehydrogenase (short-subunit alcohol dehydrogenase family)